MSDPDTRNPKPDAPGTGAPRRILIVRPSALGDVSRTVPALVTLRRAYPEAQIDWLVSHAFADAILHHPALNNVLRYDRHWMKKVFQREAPFHHGVSFTRRLRTNGYDIVYDLQGLFRSGVFTWLTRAPRRVGFACAREAAWLGYNVRHPVNGEVTHTVDRMLALLEHDGLTPVRDMRLYVSPENAAFVDEALAKPRQDGFTADHVCIAPTARWKSKCWPIERYAEVVDRLRAAAPRRPIVVLAAPNEASQVAPLAGKPGVVVPKTAVGQMMAILQQTRLLVCNDSAALHIAVGFDRPVVAIFGPTNPDVVGPYRRPDSVIQPEEARAAGANYREANDDQTLIAKVDVDTVWRKIEATLAASP